MTSFLRASLALVVMAGCDGATAVDAGALADAGASMDASASMDAGDGADAGLADAGADAAVALDAGASDAGSSDAGPSDASADAAVALDAGSSDAGPPPDPADLCDALCTTLQMCVSAPPGEFENCVTDCTADLADCSPPQLGELRACQRAPDACVIDPVTMAPKLITCIMGIACVMG